jgi:two-component system, NarL family, sensor kinase
MRLEVVAFLIVPLLVLGAVAAGTVLLSERIARANALTQAEQVATRFTRVLLAPALDRDLARDRERVQDGRPARWTETKRLVTDRLSDGSMTFLFVWSTDGIVLFSSVKESIGEWFEPTDDLRVASSGRTVAGIAESDDQPEASYEHGPTDPSVEVYVPVDLEDQRVVVEAYFSYDGIEQQAALLRNQLIPLAVGALVVLQLIQLPIATSLARRVRRQETERAELMARSLRASERDRRSLAADVHDGPVQDLAGVSYALSALRTSVPDDRKAGVDRLVGAVRNAVHSLRVLMVDLYPPDLQGSGLASALEDLAEPLRGEGLTVEVTASDVPELSPDSAAVTYRTAKELLLNVSRHAAATNVWVDVEPVEHGRDGRVPAIRLCVRDDGVGFPAGGTDKRSEGHLGLSFVADRVRDVGGDFELQDRPGGGASVTAVIPTGFVP